MTATSLSSMVCTRLKIVRGISHAMCRKEHNSPHLDGFWVLKGRLLRPLGCLIRGRRGHFQDTSETIPESMARLERELRRVFGLDGAR
jgi:hypothetical protein